MVGIQGAGGNSYSLRTLLSALESIEELSLLLRTVGAILKRQCLDTKKGM